MTLAIAIEKARPESEIGHALEIVGHVHDRPDGLNEPDTKVAFVDPILSALGWELRDPFSVSQQDRRHHQKHNRVEWLPFVLRSPMGFRNNGKAHT